MQQIGFREQSLLHCEGIKQLSFKNVRKVKGEEIPLSGWIA